MIIKGFDKTTMEKVFRSFLSREEAPVANFLKHKQPPKMNTFQTRRLKHEEKVENALPFTEEQRNEADIDFKNYMAFLNLKTFVDKSPSDFKTEAYKQECKRINQLLQNYDPKVRAKVVECLKKGSVNYVAGELPTDLFYDRLKEIGLSTDDSNTKVFITPNSITQCRIYVNPSQKDYAHLVKYLYEKAAKDELFVKCKFRLDGVSTTNLDNLVIYTDAKDFPKVVKVLNNYGKEYPDKVASFNGTMECLCRSEQDWFGFGYEPQRTDNHSYSTFNSDIDDIFNNYVLPTVILIDIPSKITINKELENKIVDHFCATHSSYKKEDVTEFINLIRTNPYYMILNEFSNLKNVEEKSIRLTNELGGGERIPKGQYRKEIGTGDVALLVKEELTFNLRNGKQFKISRKDLSEMLNVPELNEKIVKYYDTPEKIQQKSEQMVSLWKNVGKYLPYLNDQHPGLSTFMYNAIQNHEKHK